MARLTWDFAVWGLRNSWLAMSSLLNPAAIKITWYSPVLDEIGHSPRDGVETSLALHYARHATQLVGRCECCSTRWNGMRTTSTMPAAE